MTCKISASSRAAVELHRVLLLHNFVLPHVTSLRPSILVRSANRDAVASRLCTCVIWQRQTAMIFGLWLHANPQDSQLRPERTDWSLCPADNG